MRHLLVATLVVAMSCLPAAGQTEPQPTSSTDFSALITTVMHEHHLPGAGAAIVTSSGVIWARGYGFENAENGRAASLDSIFDLMSVSKVFTATTLLTLVEEDRVSLDDRIDPHLPFAVTNPSHPAAPITFRMLLTHTSSINDDFETIGELYGEGDPSMGLESFLRSYLTPSGDLYRESHFLKDAPGETYRYSNVAYALTGYLVERIAGRQFPDYCRQKLFDPVGMPGAGWYLSDIDLQHLAVRYRADRDRPGELIAGTPGSWPGYPDGQLRATMLEVGAFLEMILSGGKKDSRQVLRAETVDLMFAPQGLDRVQINARTLLPKSDLALPWQLVGLAGHPVAMHTGRGAGMASCVLIDRDAGFGAILWLSGSLQSREVFVDLLEALHDKGLRIAP